MILSGLMGKILPVIFKGFVFCFSSTAIALVNRGIVLADPFFVLGRNQVFFFKSMCVHSIDAISLRLAAVSNAMIMIGSITWLRTFLAVSRRRFSSSFSSLRSRVFAP